MIRLTDGLEESGLALVTALLVVVLVGALILGVFATSVSDYRIGRNLLFQEQALAGATTNGPKVARVKISVRGQAQQIDVSGMPKGTYDDSLVMDVGVRNRQ